MSLDPLHSPLMLVSGFWLHQGFHHQGLGREFPLSQRLFSQRPCPGCTQKGRNEGLKEGRNEERRTLVQQLLDKKFGPLDEHVRLDAATPEALAQYAEPILTATSLDDVWG